jgi:hypothetical protein
LLNLRITSRVNGQDGIARRPRNRQDLFDQSLHIVVVSYNVLFCDLIRANIETR